MILRETLPEIAALVRERVPTVLGWPAERLEEWIAWYATRDLLGLVTREGRIVGVGMARPVRPGQGERHYAMDWQGDTVWIDCAVATDRAATRDLWFLLVHRFGPRTWVGYHRAKHGGRKRREPFDRFINRFFRSAP